jgi:hypothetical protein
MPEDYERWLHGSFDDAVSFQDRCFPDALIEMTRTSELWVKKKAVAEAPSLL